MEKGWGLGGEQGGEKNDKPPLIPILKPPAFRGTEFFVFYSISASCTMATKMSDSHISLWDHNFLLFQLFLTSSSTIHMLSNITETPSASFLHSYQNIPGISSFFSQPRTLDNFMLGTIKPTLSSASHPPPDTSAGAGFLGRGTSSVPQGHTLRRWPPTWGLFSSIHHIEIINNFTFAFVSWNLSNGAMKHVSGAWRLFLHGPSSPPWDKLISVCSPIPTQQAPSPFMPDRRWRRSWFSTCSLYPKYGVGFCGLVSILTHRCPGGARGSMMTLSSQ